MAPKYILNYFDAPGSGEAIRLMFVTAGVEFTDNRISQEDWPNNKSDSKRFPLGQMPTLQVDDKVICQSKAIYRYVANELGFYGSNNLEKAIIDQVGETLHDWTVDFFPIVFGGHDDETKKKKFAEFYASDKLKKQLTFIQNFLKNNNGGTGFFVGDKISLADISFYGATLNFIKPNRVSPGNSTLLDSYPELKALIERIEAVDSIKKYYQK